MRSEAEIRERIADNEEKLMADRISNSYEHALMADNLLLKWVLGE